MPAKTLEDLGNFYSTTLKSGLEELEAERQQVKTYATLLFIVAGILTAVAALSILTAKGGTAVYWPHLVQLLMVAGALTAGLFYWITRGYCRDFKSKVIAKLVTFIDPSLQYDQDGFIPQATFVNSLIFQSRTDRYSGHDNVSGTLGQTSLQFSEIHAENKTHDDKGDHYSTIFKGIFFVAGFNKNFNGHTLVLPDLAKGWLGTAMGELVQSMNVFRGELVKLEDPEFGKAFVVYSTDQVEARYILTPGLMRRILDYKTTNKERIHLSFVNNQIHVAISQSRDIFRPRVFGRPLSFDEVLEYYERLKIIVLLVDELKLNTRLWGQQAAS